MPTIRTILRSLEMKGEILPFSAVYIQRIAQLTNKSNQFNLTTRRYTPDEIEGVAKDGRHIALYGRLTDRFGDNGVVSVVIGELKGEELHMDLWIMSCPRAQARYGIRHAGHACQAGRS